MIQYLLNSPSTQAQMFRYFIVAAVGLAVDFGVVIFTKEVLDFYYLLAACTGFTAGLIVTYTLSNMVVFGTPKGDKRTLFVMFAVIGVVGLGILNLLMWIMTGQMGINYIVSKALATIFVFMWNFFARKSLYKDKASSLPYEL